MVDFLFIFLLILINGVFAASEMAMIAAKKTRLASLIESGNETAAATINIQENPGYFLATIQIGITLVGAFASAIGGVGASALLTPWIAQIPLLEPYAQSIAIAIFVFFLSYLTLVIGELVPKRIALLNPERIALLVTRPYLFLSRIAKLPIKILDFSAQIVLRLFTKGDRVEPSTSADEIELIIRQASVEGVIEPVEEKLISRVFDFADLKLWDIMTPRTSIIAIDTNASPHEALDMARQHGFSRYPIYEGNLDNILGYLHLKDFIWSEQQTTLRNLTRDVIFIPGGMSLPDAFTKLTKAGKHMAIVLDEFGGTDGLLTLEDLLEVIFGEIEDEHSPLLEKIGEQQDRPQGDVWLLSGSIPISTVQDQLKLKLEPSDEYTTLAGYLLAELGKIPDIGEVISRHGFTFTVKSMDRLRIDKIEIKRDISGKNEG